MIYYGIAVIAVGLIVSGYYAGYDWCMALGRVCYRVARYLKAKFMEIT